jgi:hypothetical protein
MAGIKGEVKLGLVKDKAFQPRHGSARARSGVLVFQARSSVPNPAGRGVDGEVVEQWPWLGWLAGARRKRVRAGTGNLGPRHGRDACGTPASRAAATSWL